MEYFLNNLVKTNNGESLLQGEKFVLYNKSLFNKEKRHTKLIQETSSRSLGSIQEAMNSKSSLQKKNENVVMFDIDDIENEFNNTLQHYTTIYKEYITDIISRNKAKAQFSKYFGKYVYTDNGDMYYINNYGYKQNLKNNSGAILKNLFNKNDGSILPKNCSKNHMKITNNELQQFESGANMNIHQPCNMVGKNIQNQNGDKKWIDIKGEAYNYTEDVWEKRNKTCNLKPVILTNEEFDSFNSNNEMTSSISCNRMLIDKSKLKELIQLNDKLVELSTKLKVDIGQMFISDVELNKQISDKKSELNEYIDKLKKDKLNLEKTQDNINTLKERGNLSELYKNNNISMLIFWSILTAIIILTIINVNLMNIRSNSKYILAIVFLLIMIYLIVTLVKKNTYYY